MNSDNTSRLAGISILIVEDDEALQERLKRTLVKAGAKSVTMKSCMTAGLEELKLFGETYNLIVVDVMLPESEENLDAIKKIDADLAEIRKVFVLADSVRDEDKERTQELEGTYKRRAHAVNMRESLIVADGGLQMLEQWLGGRPTPPMHPPILFLTSVVNLEAMNRGMYLAGKNAEWLVKPVMTETLCEKAAALIRAAKTPVVALQAEASP